MELYQYILILIGLVAWHYVPKVHPYAQSSNIFIYTDE